MKNKAFSTLFAFILLSALLSSCTKQNLNIPDQDFNSGWLFYNDSVDDAESISFNDSEWRKLDLPHDWAIEGPFDVKYNARCGGLPFHGTGWYRKHFTIENEYREKKISVEFDGAMNNAHVWLNGEFIGERPYGYIGFEFDLTPHIKFGEENIIAVRLTPEDLSSRWYPGAGIYRNVRLKINEPIHIPQYGTFITNTNLTDSSATINISTEILNSKDHHELVTLITQIIDPDGNKIAISLSEINLLAARVHQDKQTIDINNPKRWDIESPMLYKAISIIKIGGVIRDIYNTEFGIRKIEFTANNGFKLNGRRVNFKGVCNHHDQGPLGTAVNYRAKERQMEILKSMGVNALRTSHNPPAPELLQICNRLGILVQVEAFDEWKIGKVPNGYNKAFDKWHERDLRDMIRRDRNHPSVIMWSIGNEILEQGVEDGWKLAKKLSDICHEEDTTRPNTAGFNYYPASFTNKLAYQIDLVGMNYKPSFYDEIKEQNPDMILYGSETSSLTSSRGVYHLPIEPAFMHHTKQVSSYDVVVGPPWAYPPDVEFDAQERVPSSLGEFIWTGFDYLGEPTPYGGRDNSTNGYWNEDWPVHSSYFAPVDLCGLPKDRFYLYQSQWTTEPMVHVLPHWNWPGKEGKNIPVFVYTNCQEAELFINGKSFRKKVKGIDKTMIPAEFAGFELGLYESKYRLSWKVPYQPGNLKVVVYNDGNPVAEKEVRTAGPPAQISLMPDRETIYADGKDISFITVSIEDKEGNLCPLANNLVTFTVEGSALLKAVGNGDPSDISSFQANNRKAFNGKCMLYVVASEIEGKVEVKASSDGLKNATVQLNTISDK